MKIPFTLEAWLKDKSQKVETRDGRLVHNIWQIKEPFYTNNRKAEVCALIDGEEDALVFFEGGRYLPTTQDTDNPFDLFIVTPEPELSEFEDKLRVICEDAVIESRLFPERTSEDFAKKHSAELLAIATEELKKTFVLLHKDDYQTAFDLGKAEAMKDLPRWKKTTNCWTFVNASNMLFHNGYYLGIKDLEKLPKED